MSPFATRLTLRFDPPIGPQACAARLRELLQALARIEERVPGAVVGHIKLFAELPGGGYVRGSAVSAARTAEVEVVAAGDTPIQSLALDLNVLVLGCPAAGCRDHVHAVVAGWGPVAVSC